MNPKKTTTAAIAVAVSIAGGVLAVDATQADIALNCDTASAVVENLDEKLRTYKIDEGLLQVRDMTAKDKRAIKGCEISKKLKVGTYQLDETTKKFKEKTKKTTFSFFNAVNAQEITATSSLEIEVVETKPFDDGVEVFARVWVDGVQIGFGVDGTVDIERFRFINPPILISDPNGEIVRVDPATSVTPAATTTYTENPSEAILQVLAHNISIMTNIHGPEKIIVGKRGNTTSTFYPDANPESTSFDGWCSYDNLSSSWDTTHDATSCNSPNDTLASSGVFADSTWLATNFRITRAAVLFDTSALPDSDGISSAVMSVYFHSKSDGDNDAQAYLAVVDSTPASNTGIAAGDYDLIGDAINNPTKLSSDVDITGITTGTYTDFTLNGSGISAISKTGITKLGLREGHDIEDISIVSTNKASRADGYGADQSGTSQDPKLVIEHSAASERRIIRTTGG